MLPVSTVNRRTPRRRGFTLIELLVAVAIISVLIALIAPAVLSALRSAREARVRVEIGNLASAIAAFKAQFGHEPPSRITLHANQVAWDADPTSKGIIASLWPQFDFTQNDLSLAGSVTLNAPECLVFFLGGVPTSVAAPAIPAPTGFSKNVSRPFQAGTSGRDGPFFEFDKSRLIRTNNPANTSTNLIVYVDSVSGNSGIAKPYLYFSSYEGTGYVAGDLTGIANVYLTASGGPAWNPQSFQIISAGPDGEYGSGGVYDTAQSNAGLSSPFDFDNITNITTSTRLKP